MLADAPDRPRDEPSLYVEVIAGPELLGVHLLRRWELNTREHKFTFVVSQEIADGIAAIETRICILSPVDLAVHSLTVNPSPASINSNDQVAAALIVSDLLRIDNWLLFLRTGPLGRSDGSGVSVESGEPAFGVYGPYWSLPAGKYEMTARLENNHDAAAPKHVIKADVVVPGRYVAVGSFHINELPYDEKSGTSLLRLPFELHAQAPEERQIETRIWSSGEQRFRIRSLLVKPLERQRQDLIFPSLLIGDLGNRLGGEIRNFNQQIGFVDYGQIVLLRPGAYRLTLAVTTEPAPLQEEQTSLTVVVKQGNNILAATSISPGAARNETHQMVFEAVSDSADVAEIELQLRVAAAANITLHNLTIDPVEAEVEPVELESPRTVPAACELENWLPFLETRRRGVDDRDGIFVSEGRAECSVYGPYWALPAGRYEVIASIVPSSPNPEGKPVITLDVVTEGGKRLLAMYQWRLGHFECADALTAVELRLPFAIAGDDLPIESRQIETRIFTSGDGSFRIRSLAVRVSSAKPQRNWWPYLAAGECGIHSGGAIKSIVGEFGYVAGTPAMNIAPGNYKIIAERGRERRGCSGPKRWNRTGGVVRIGTH